MAYFSAHQKEVLRYSYAASFGDIRDNDIPPLILVGLIVRKFGTGT